MPAILQIKSREPEAIGGIRKLSRDLAYALRNLRVAEKISGIAVLLVVVMTLLVAMSIQSVRLQSDMASARDLLDGGDQHRTCQCPDLRDRDGIARYLYVERPCCGEAVCRRAHQAQPRAGRSRHRVGEDRRLERRGAVFRLQGTNTPVHRLWNELVYRATRISPAAGREWGDNDANRALRSQLNVDLEAIGKDYHERATLVEELADRTQLASWYLALLGLCGLLLTALNVAVVRRSVVTPLSDIAKATDSIADGKIDINIPYIERWTSSGTSPGRCKIFGMRSAATSSWSSLSSAPRNSVMPQWTSATG